MAKVSVDDQGGVGWGYEDLFLYSRNKRWIPIMSSMMKDKSTFLQSVPDIWVVPGCHSTA